MSVEVDLPPEVAAQVEALRQQSEAAEEAAREAAEMQARLVASLTTDAGLTGREGAAILKVTPGRLVAQSQIARKAAVQRAGVAKSA